MIILKLLMSQNLKFYLENIIFEILKINSCNSNELDLLLNG